LRYKTTRATIINATIAALLLKPEFVILSEAKNLQASQPRSPTW
jgi:hypothetical protein